MDFAIYKSKNLAHCRHRWQALGIKCPRDIPQTKPFKTLLDLHPQEACLGFTKSGSYIGMFQMKCERGELGRSASLQLSWPVLLALPAIHPQSWLIIVILTYLSLPLVSIPLVGRHKREIMFRDVFGKDVALECNGRLTLSRWWIKNVKYSKAIQPVCRFQEALHAPLYFREQILVEPGVALPTMNSLFFPSAQVTEHRLSRTKGGFESALEREKLESAFVVFTVLDPEEEPSDEESSISASISIVYIRVDSATSYTTASCIMEGSIPKLFPSPQHSTVPAPYYWFDETSSLVVNTSSGLLWTCVGDVQDHTSMMDSGIGWRSVSGLARPLYWRILYSAEGHCDLSSYYVDVEAWLQQELAGLSNLLPFSRSGSLEDFFIDLIPPDLTSSTCVAFTLSLLMSSAGLGHHAPKKMRYLFLVEIELSLRGVLRVLWWQSDTKSTGNPAVEFLEELSKTRSSKREPGALAKPKPGQSVSYLAHPTLHMVAVKPVVRVFQMTHQ